MEIFSILLRSFGEKDTEKILKIIGILFKYFFNISVPSIVQCIQCRRAFIVPRYRRKVTDKSSWPRVGYGSLKRSVWSGRADGIFPSSMTTGSMLVICGTIASCTVTAAGVLSATTREESGLLSCTDLVGGLLRNSCWEYEGLKQEVWLNSTIRGGFFGVPYWSRAKDG